VFDVESVELSIMKNPIRFCACVLAAGAAFAVAARADAPHIYAITGARIVTAAGAPIASGTVVIRNGLIEAVGEGIQAPSDAMVIEGKGMTVYPGLIDMGTSIGVDIELPEEPENPRTTEEVERWKRTVIFRPDVEAATHVRPDSPELARLASQGVTSVLATPPGVIFKGQSALVNVTGPVDEPQIGNVGDYRRGLQVVRAPVALHVEFPGNVRGGAYPVSLLGAIAFVRQSFLDAQHQQLSVARYQKVATSTSRPPYDPTLDALQPALAGRLPVAFEAGEARDIGRALDMAQEFKLDPVITGAREADQMAPELKARNARVIYNVNFPTRSRMLPPDADEPLSALRTRANAPKVPAALEKAGILFAFSSAGLREQGDFVRNVARAVKDGLPAEAAIRALTINAAKIAGAADRLGTIEKGKIANIVVTEGDLFDEKLQVRHVFVDGRSVTVEEPQPERRGGRGGN
jgi:imidazolonepropionase-like amidohydrolase